MVTNSTLSERMKEHGIRVKKIKEITAQKGWGRGDDGYSESYIRLVSYGDKSCPKLEDLIEEIIRRAEFIYSV